MASIPVLPVMNGMLPRIGGMLTGIVLEPNLIRTMLRLGTGGEVFVAPVPANSTAVYQVGVLCKIRKVYLQPIYRDSDATEIVQGVFVELEGRASAKAERYEARNQTLCVERLELLDFRSLRPAYPVISGLGWTPLGGYTEARGKKDIEVTVYGVGSDGEEGAYISAELGGVISVEEAHTVEHAVIRSLKNYGLCSPRTLLASWREETGELKASLEAGFKFKLPELFGVTASGACGNPLTNLAQFYLTREFFSGLHDGRNIVDSLQSARLKTLSHIAADLEIPSDAGLRVLQGLKRGMQHTDEPTLEQIASKVLNRFPVSPWE